MINLSSSPATQTEALLKRMAEEQLMAIVRTPSTAQALWATRILVESGFRFIEIPWTVPNAADVIETLVTEFPEAIIGAGTVLEASQAVHALGAGAQFLVSPILLEPLIQLGKAQDIAVLPGCMTPTEIYNAHAMGAPAIKLFPAQCAGGASFLQALKGPLPHIPIVPTGGIHLGDVASYLKAGALAVGIGSPMLPREVLENQDAVTLKATAHAYLQTRNDVD